MKSTNYFTLLTLLGIVFLGACESTSNSSTSEADSGSVIKHTPSTVQAGYITFQTDEGHTWVFRDNSETLHKFAKGEELAKHTTKLVSTPAGVKTYKSDNIETLVGYLAMKPGYAARVLDGYLWVFYTNSPELSVVDSGGELAKHVTKIANVAGDVRTIKAPSIEIVKAYLAAKPGFIARIVDDYLWIFMEGSEEYETVAGGGELAKHVTKISSTPEGVMTIKAPDMETIKAYLSAKPGFATRYVDGYLWVFVEGSEEYETVAGGGELAKHVTKISSTPEGVMTIKAPDMDIIKAYLMASAE